MYSLKQLVISGRKRRWILMDLETSLPLLYPLRYHIDHLAFRSLSTQSASLQSVKFFYEFWRQKYGVSFCYSFYSSDHNPDIAVGEMPAFWMYLENGHNVQSNVLSLTRVTKANSLTHTVRVRAVIHFISFLINTYISPAYRDDSPKALSLLASRLHTRLQLCRENYRTLTSNKFSQHSHSSQGFQSLSGAMVLSLYGIITPSSAQKHNPLNPFPSGHLQFRNFLIIRLLLNYGLRTGELLLLECSSIKPNLKGDKFSLIVTTVDEAYEPRKNAPSLKNAWANRVLELDKQDYIFLSIYIAKLRPKTDKHDFIFTSSQQSAKPLSYTSVHSICFNLEDYDDLEFVPRPYLEHWGVYQEIDNILDPLEKNMICNGLFEMASLLRDGKSFSHSEVRNAAILGLAYVTGARPVQLARLAVKDVRIDTRNQESGLIRYSVFLPYAKQRRVTTERLFLAIPPEIGELIMNYTVRYKKNPEDKLFDFSVSAPHYVSQAINQAILNFCPPEYQAAVACGEAALPTITPTDLRHNVGHSLAMQGASAEEIAHVLGHTSLAVAKYYIMATPALALIRAKALGSNPVWQNMVAMMLTGELVDSAHWKGHPVVGLVGDELHDKIGGCSRNSSTCPFSEVRSCYGCLYYRPFTDGEHQALLECVKKEVDELIAISDGVGNSRNPLILIHETTQFEIESVIARCRFHQEQVKSNEKSL